MVSDAIMVITVKAILGAVYMDNGDESLSTVMENLNLTHDLLIVITPSLNLFRVLCPHYEYPFRFLYARLFIGRRASDLDALFIKPYSRHAGFRGFNP